MNNEEILNLVDESSRQKIIAEIIERQKRLERENQELKTQLSHQEKAVELLVTEGLDTRSLPPLDKIAPYFNLRPEELTTLMQQNRDELFKRAFRIFLEKEKRTQLDLQDRQLDMDGNAFGDILKEVRDFFVKHPDTSNMDIPLYKEIAKKFPSAQQMSVDYLKITADHSNSCEALAYLYVYIKITDLQSNAKKKVSTDYVKEAEKIEAEKQEAEQPKPSPEIENIKFELKEQKSLLESIKDSLLGREKPKDEELPAEPEEEPEEPAEEPKKGKKK